MPGVFDLRIREKETVNDTVDTKKRINVIAAQGQDGPGRMWQKFPFYVFGFNCCVFSQIKSPEQTLAFVEFSCPSS